MRKLLVRLGYVFAVSAVSAVAACGSATRRTGEQGLDPTREVIVSVKNENFYDATVYTCRRTHQDRLGVVTSNGTREFKFRWVNADLRFLVDFIGGGRFLTTAQSVETGDQLEFIITPNMHRGRGNARCF